MTCSGRRLQFFTSVGGIAFVHRFLQELSAAGWVVDAVSAVDEGPYRSSGRFGRLGANWRRFIVASLRLVQACRRPANVRIVTTNPFFAPWLATLASKDGVPVVTLLWDLYPDALEVNGSIGVDSLPSRALGWVTRRTLSRSAATVFLGRFVKDSAESRYGKAKRSVVIPVGADARPFHDHWAEPVPAGCPVRILYCGLLGRMHDIATVASLFRSERPVVAGAYEWVFHASGNGVGVLEHGIATRDPGWSVVISGPLPGEAWISAMRSAHIALVTVRAGAERVVVPSKVYSALAAGQAILGICTRGSDLAELIEENECGWTVEPGDVEGLAGILGSITGDRAALNERRSNALHAGRTRFDMGAVVRDWLPLLESVTTGQG